MHGSLSYQLHELSISSFVGSTSQSTRSMILMSSPLSDKSTYVVSLSPTSSTYLKLLIIFQFHLTLSIIMVPFLQLILTLFCLPFPPLILIICLKSKLVILSQKCFKILLLYYLHLNHSKRYLKFLNDMLLCKLNMMYLFVILHGCWLILLLIKGY